MQRVLVGACLLAVAVCYAGADEVKASDATKAFKALEKEFMEQYKAERDNKKRTEVLKSFAGKFLAHAEKNAKDDSAFDALVYVLRMTQPTKDKDDSGTKALAILKQNYAKGKRIAKVLPVIAVRGEEGPEVLKTIVAEHPDKKTQAKAAKMMQQVSEQYAKVGKQLKDNEKLKAQAEASSGKEFVDSLVANVDKNAKAAKEYEKLLKDKYADAFPVVAVGKPAPEVVSETLDGKAVKLSELKGKVVVLDVWATWCGPCVSMIPHTKKLVEKMKDKPFVFISASADDSKDTVKAFLKKREMPWTHWWIGPSDGLVEDWQIESFPTIYLIDAKGVIREKVNSADQASINKIDEVAEKLVKEAEEPKK